MTGILLLAMMATGIAVMINFHEGKNAGTSAGLAEQIDAILPQTQCEKCGYPGCRPYAEAIAAGKAAINQCPPGGRVTIRKLATLLGRPVVPLDVNFGSEGPKMIALIDENLCIGCVKCIQACPVDAIVGAPKQMHTVVTRLCTGCELCVEPCPVDCIDMMVFLTGNKKISAEKISRPGQST